MADEGYHDWNEQGGCWISSCHTRSLVASFICVTTFYLRTDVPVEFKLSGCLCRVPGWRNERLSLSSLSKLTLRLVASSGSTEASAWSTRTRCTKRPLMLACSIALMRGYSARCRACEEQGMETQKAMRWWKKTCKLLILSVFPE